ALGSASEPHLPPYLGLSPLSPAHRGRMSALAGSPLWCSRRAITAVYRLSSRHHLSVAGLVLDWDLGPDGRADLSRVPRSAIEAVSRRHRQIVEQVTTLDRTPGRARNAKYRSRNAEEPAVAPSGSEIVADGWARRAHEAGFGAAEAAGMLEAAGEREAARVMVDGVGVTNWLAQQRSAFAVRDVLAALAATVPEGTAGRDAEAWASAFCANAIPVAGGRWTTAHARRLDHQLVAAAHGRAGAGVGVAARRDITEAVKARRWLDGRSAQAVEELTRSGDGVTVLGGAAGRDSFWSQAAVLDAAGALWQATGYRVSVLTGSPAAARRWEAITSLKALTADARVTRPGESRDERFAGLGVLIVDRADRHPTGELSDLVDWSRRRAVKVVLLEGGTQPARRQAISAGMTGTGDLLGRVQTGPGPDIELARSSPGAVLPTPSTHLSGAEAAGHLLETWWSQHLGGAEIRMVAMGPAETEVLNAAARSRLVSAGEIGGQGLQAGRRCYQAGDRVMGIRRAAVQAGTLGRVVEVDGPHKTMTIDWGGGWHTTIDRHDAARISHAYATTPAMLRLLDGPVAVLGPPSSLGHHARRVRAAFEVVPAICSSDMAYDRLERQSGRKVPRVDWEVPADRQLPGSNASRLGGRGVEVGEARRPRMVLGEGLGLD
ncbi:MAG: relaxase domain-containing protein, partial [Acidimicrobiales bacterium]